MAEDERLREALIELKMLREREAAALRVSDAIVDALASITVTDQPGEAVDRLLRSIAASLDCPYVLLITRRPDGTRIEHSTEPSLEGQPFPDAVMAARGPMRIVDTTALSWWHDLPEELGAMRSALGAPIHLADAPSAVILCLSPARYGFSPLCKTLLSRLTSLAAQALRSVALSERNRLLAGVIDGSSASVAIADANAEELPLVYVNEAFERLSGFHAEEVLGHNCRFLSDEPADGPERARLRAAVRQREGGTFVLRNRRRDGSIFWNRLTLYPIAGPSGGPDFLVATQVDITAERAAEAARVEAEYRLTAALSATSEAFLLLDAYGKVTFANARFREFFEEEGAIWTTGMLFEDAWSQRLQAMGTPRGQARRLARARLATVMGGAENREERLPDGRILLLNDRPLSNGGAVSIATDITSLKATERMLAQRAAAIDATQDGIAVTDEEGRFVYMNAAHLHMFGYHDETEILGKSWQTLYEPDQAALIERHGMPELALRGTWRTEISGRARDGSVVAQEVSLTMLKGIGLVCVTRDISERQKNEMERARLREQLSVAQRQEAVGQLAAGVAHDFNNLLSVISASASLIDDSLRRDHPARPHVERIRAAGTQAAGLVGKLLETGRRRSVGRLFDVAEALREAVDLLQPGVPMRIAVTTSLPEGAMPAFGDPGDLLQVVLNLGINARDAIAEKAGEIAIQLEVTDGSPDTATAVGELAHDRRYAMIKVSDTGPGMTEAVQRDIFTPYYTTKGNTGTGLGLAVVASIVRKIGGAVRLNSSEDAGSSFTVYWPLVSEAAASAPVTPCARSTSRAALNGATIILCDDVAEVAESLAAILESAGAEVAVCTDPRDALAAIKEDPEAWSMLITDFDMAHIDGAALARYARQARASLPIVLCTAMAERVDRRGLFDAVVLKPIDPDQLLSSAAAAIDAREAVTEEAKR